MNRLTVSWTLFGLLLASACEPQSAPPASLPPAPPLVVATETPLPLVPATGPTLTLTIGPVTDTPPPFPTDTAAPSGTLAIADTATPIPTGATVLGEHVVARGDTLSCVGRAYGVLPKAIADASGIDLNTTLFAGQVLKIPPVQWTDIPAGPVCVAQFQSPYPPYVPQPGATLAPVASAVQPSNTLPPIPPPTGTPTAIPPATPTNTIRAIPGPSLTRCFPRPCPPPLPTPVPPQP